MNRYFRTVVLEKTLESPLDNKEIKPVNSKGNQSWIFIGKADTEADTPMLWPPDAIADSLEKTLRLEDWRQKEERAAEEEMVRYHHWLNSHDFEQILEILKDKGAWCAAVHGVEVRHDLATEQQQQYSTVDFLVTQW